MGRPRCSGRPRWMQVGADVGGDGEPVAQAAQVASAPAALARSAPPAMVSDIAGRLDHRGTSFGARRSLHGHDARSRPRDTRSFGHVSSAAVPGVRCATSEPAAAHPPARHGDASPPTGRSSIGGCRVDELAAAHGTPVFVYDEEHLRARCREAVDGVRAATGGLRDQGVPVPGDGPAGPRRGDAARRRQRRRAARGAGRRRAGRRRARCTATTRASTSSAAAIEAGVRHVVVDSFDELDRLDALHARRRRSRAGRAAADHAGRARPHPRVHRHRPERLEVRLQPRQRRRRPGGRAGARLARRVHLVGLHCHIGSNVFAAESFGRAAEVMATFAAPLDLPELVLGGGLGVAYVEGEEAPTIAEWAKVVLDVCAVARRAVDGQRRAGPGDRRRRRRHRSTRSARSSRSPACGRTSPSTAA